MSTPQDPGSGETPQDPANPQNPYGTPPNDPPTTAIPAAPSPYGTGPSGAPTPPPPAAPPTGAPTYGEASTPPPPPAYPAYDQPQPGQPQYSQPEYSQPGQPQYAPPPGQYGSEEPGKGMAIAALIISFFGCVIIGALVAIPLAIVVLVRSRDGRNHGKGLAIAAIVVSLLTLALPIIGLVAGVSYVNSLTDVNDLDSGDCITATGLTDSDSDSVSDIETVSCSDSHDGQVLATVELTAQQAQDYETTQFSVICDPAIEEAGNTGLLSDTVTYTALTVADPEEGDHAACVAYNVDGSKLTSELGS